MAALPRRHWSSMPRLGVAYLAFYASWALNFSPQRGRQRRLGRGHHQHGLQRLPAGRPRGAAPAGTTIGAVLPRLAQRRDRDRQRRHLGAGAPRDPPVAVQSRCAPGSLPAFFLGCDIVLVLAGRVSFVGALISLDFRYQGELPAVTAVALACATMPILGARDRVEVARGAASCSTTRSRVAAATAAVAVLSLVSSTTYVTYWSDTMKARPTSTTCCRRSARPRSRSRWSTTPVPGFVMWELGYPDNLLSHLLLALRRRDRLPRRGDRPAQRRRQHGRRRPRSWSPVSGTACPGRARPAATP